MQASQTFLGNSFMILCYFFLIFYAILCQIRPDFMLFYANVIFCYLKIRQLFVNVTPTLGGAEFSFREYPHYHALKFLFV